MTIADTHALVWLWTGDDRLGPNARQTIDGALRDGDLAVSAMNGHELVTADRRILAWSGRLRCVDAAR